MDLIEAVHTRRSVRAFEPREVPRALTEAILIDASTAPPPFIGHEPAPWRFHVFDGVERVADFGERGKKYALQHRTGVPGLIELDAFKLFWDAPVVILIYGNAEDCGRAAMILMLSATARGLGSCWVGSPMPWLNDADTRLEIGLTGEVGAALCLGYAMEPPTSVQRQPPMVFWE